MIFVTVGTNEAPFDRLLRAVDALDLDEELVVQHGSSSVRPGRAACVDFLPFDELVDHVRRARVVVGHAGVGTVLVALANDKRSVVVPRLRRFGEAVDDHQAVFARRLHDVGLVRLVDDPATLAEALRHPPGTPPANGHEGGLADDLRSYLIEALEERAAALR